MPNNRRARPPPPPSPLRQHEADSIVTRQQARQQAREQAEAERLAAQQQLEAERWDAYKSIHPSMSHPYRTRYKARLEAKVKASVTPVLAPAPVPRRRRKAQAVNTEVEAPQPELHSPAAAAAAAAASSSSSSSSSSDRPAPSSTSNPTVSSSGALSLKRPRADTEEEDDEEDASAVPLRRTKKPRSEEESSSNEGRKRPHQEDESEGDDGSVTADGFINDASEGSTRPAKRMRHTSPTSDSSERQADNEELSEYEEFSEDESEGSWVARASSARPFVFDVARLKAEGATEEQQGEDDENGEEDGGEPRRAFSAPPWVPEDTSGDLLRVNGMPFESIKQELAEKFEEAAIVNSYPADDHAEALVYQHEYTEWQVTWQRPEHLETATTKETGPQFNVDNIQSWSATTYPENENKLVTFSIGIDGLRWEVTQYNPDHIGEEPGRPIYEQEFDSDSDDQPPSHIRQVGYGNQVNRFGRPPYTGTFGSDSEDDNWLR